MRYNPALDGLRAFAIVMVALCHAGAAWGMGGYLGVDVFFVLSGYLITSLLLAELEAGGQVDLAGFWRRRVLRLTPALFAMLAVYMLLAPLLWPAITSHGTQAAIAAVYLSDYVHAWWPVAGHVGHTWSLAVEMHFYLFWPVVLTWAWRRWKRGELVQVLLVAWVLATLLRWACIVRGQDWDEVYYRTDTRLSGLMLGAWLAAALRVPAWRDALQRLLPWMMWLPVAAILCLRNPWRDLWMAVWGFGIAEWATVAALVAVQRPSSQLALMFSRPTIAWLGKMSYGTYLWHYPIFVWLRERYAWGMVLCIGLPLSVGIAALSFHTIEAWAARWRTPRAVVRPAS